MTEWGPGQIIRGQKLLRSTKDFVKSHDDLRSVGTYKKMISAGH